MLPALTKKNRTSYGQLLPITPPHTTHRLSGSVRKAKCRNRWRKPAGNTLCTRLRGLPIILPSSHLSRIIHFQLFCRNQIIKDVNLILGLLRQWICEESNLTTWNNENLHIHKLCPICVSYPFEYYPPLIFRLQGGVWSINIWHSPTCNTTLTGFEYWWHTIVNLRYASVALLISPAIKSDMPLGHTSGRF